MNFNDKLEDNCFVYIQGNNIDIEKYCELVDLSKDDLIILYPERHMTFLDQVCYIRYVNSVVTENPWIISSYDRKNVWIIKDGKWEHPEIQTYGASIEIIMDDILGYSSSIPLVIKSGKKGIEEYKEKIKNNEFKRS